MATADDNKINYLSYKEPNINIEINPLKIPSWIFKKKRNSNKKEKVNLQSNITSKMADCSNDYFSENIYIDNINKFSIEKIIINSKQSIFSHTICNCSEHWIMMKGTAKIQLNNDFFTISTGIHVFMPENSFYRITNILNENIIFIKIKN